MKKYLVLCAAALVAISFTSCKSSESAYKKAYEKAKAAEEVAPQVVEEVVYTPVAPVVEKPAVQPVVEQNVNVRSEDVEMVDGANLKTYSVVVGSFGVKANAERLKSTLSNNGYAAQIVRSPSTNTYRVVASTSDSKNDAANSRNKLRSTYPDAWLLMKR